MQDSSPSDLAVAFRSLPRRLRDARDGVDDSDLAVHLTDIERILGECARLLGVTPDPTVIADAVAEIPAARWDDSVLDALRSGALELGRQVRMIEELADER